MKISTLWIILFSVSRYVVKVCCECEMLSRQFVPLSSCTILSTSSNWTKATDALFGRVSKVVFTESTDVSSVFFGRCSYGGGHAYGAPGEFYRCKLPISAMPPGLV